MMNAVEQKLQSLGIELPAAKAGVGAYKSWSIFSDNILCTSGQLPWDGDELAFTGKLGDDVSVETGYQSARLCGIHAIAQLKDAVGDLTKIKQIIRVEGNLHTAAGFFDHSQVLDGASELLNHVFGEKGRHTRSALGMNASPLNVPTIVYVFAEIER